MAYDVFISYSRHDTAVVDEFVSMLEGEGFSVWIDRDGIESGDAFKREILRAIKESQVFLFFSSEHSNQSNWTAKEIGVAVKYEKHIIPIKLDNTNFNEEVEFDLINLDFVDYADASKRAGMKDRLLKTLRNKLGKERERLEAERRSKEEAERKTEKAIRKVEQERIEVEGGLDKWPVCPEGALPGVFSVSSTKKVYFSKGNLQYNIADKVWRFAEQQFELIGEGNGWFETKNQLLSRKRETFDRRDWIDLFGWGTGNHPADYSESSEGYGSFVDWGKNKIKNGDSASEWRTLTREEWKHVFETRTTKSGILYAKARVNNVNGVILLPDTWNNNYYTLKDYNKANSSFNSNVIDFSVWFSSLQAHGAVFLPVAGNRYGASVDGVGRYGYYWSASYYDSYYAFYVYFSEGSLDTSSSYERYYGRSVRLVCSAE